MSIDLLRLYVSDPSGDNEVFSDSDLQEILSRNDGDVKGAAAEAWAIKAGKVSDWFSATLDGDSLSRDQVFNHCMKMAEYYAGEGGRSIRSILLKVGVDEDVSSAEFG